MKTTFAPNQFFIQNEPRLAALLGNIGLLLAVITGIPSLLQSEGIMQVPTFLLPIIHYASIGGIVVKSLTKMCGTVDESGKPIQTTVPSVLGKPVIGQATDQPKS